ncbi:MAG: helix-turn-helix domain-containing protein [Bacilli bacterium]|nr:helix-turn-helix domain-containing protein [Bacilli bacterium]
MKRSQLIMEVMEMSKLIDSHLIGKSIKALRLTCGLTQDELADDIGYSTRNLRRIETNGTTSIDVINTFADYFNVSAMDILNGCFLFVQKQKKHWRPSSYNTYSNLLFMHVHARLSNRERL